MKTSIGLALTQNLQELNLSTMIRHLEDYLRQAREQGMDYDEFLLGLTKLELQVRAENRFKRLLKEARFPHMKTFETFNFDAAPGLDPSLIQNLASADYIWQQKNIIFTGKSGTGKTHLAIALGIKACKQGIGTRFVTGCGLVNELIEARDKKDFSRAVHKYSRCKLLILDDLGCVPFSDGGGELLFQVLNERYERGSVIMTTILEFADWTQIFGDQERTAALLDRLTHRAHIICCNWQSYRMKESLRESALH
jgi:DNA replication protein DnaC